MKKILITVKTYPEISKTHRETVCTAGVLEDSKELVRLYPIRFRYLQGDQQFKKYQWISADLEKSTKDYRPESYKVNPESIQVHDEIGTQNSWQERCDWILSENTVFNSVEDLKKRQAETNVSLGLVRPKEIFDVIIEKKTAEEIEGSEKKKDLALQQMDLFEENDNSLKIIDYRFYLKFKCDDPKCESHKLSILDWEIAQLYRKLKSQANWKNKLKSKILDEIFSPKKETYVFLGNMARWHHIFCILGFFYPPRNRPLSLF